MKKRYTNYINLPPQEKIVLAHLMQHGSITAGEAHFVHRIRSLSRRITTLLDAGCVILKEDRRDLTGQRYRRYKLEFVPDALQPMREAA